SLRWNSTGETVAGNNNGTAGSTASELTDNFNHRIQRWGPNDTSGTTVAGSASGTLGWTASLLNYPTSIYVDSSLNMYIFDMWNLRILQWLNGASGESIIAGTGVQDASGNIYATSNTANTVTRYPQGSTSGTVMVSSGLTYPWGLRFDTYGNLYVVDDGSGTIVMFCAGFTAGSVGTIVASGLNQPLDVAFDSNMN
ncbi:unnamed protein product, partial [Rotaria sp. Silwood1]